MFKLWAFHEIQDLRIYKIFPYKANQEKPLLVVMFTKT